MRARENPFRVGQLEGMAYRPQGWTWAEIARRLGELGFRAAIVGPEGTGKSTLLGALIPYLEEAGFRVTVIRLRRECPRLSSEQWRVLRECSSATDAVLVDGADLLGRIGWWRLRRQVRKCGALVVTSHGRSLLPPLVHTTTSLELLSQLVGELPGADVDDKELGRLFHRHDGNVRECLRELFDMYAEDEHDQHAEG